MNQNHASVTSEKSLKWVTVIILIVLFALIIGALFTAETTVDVTTTITEKWLTESKEGGEPDKHDNQNYKKPPKTVKNNKKSKAKNNKNKNSANQSIQKYKDLLLNMPDSEVNSYKSAKDLSEFDRIEYELNKFQGDNGREVLERGKIIRLGGLEMELV